jgi:hypothetical protein
MKISNESMDLNQEIKIEEQSIKKRIYNYFYYMLSEKTKTSIITLYILYILEILQLISYAFAEPHLKAWKMPEKSINIISIAVGAFRITPILMYLSKQINYILFVVFIISNFVLMLLIIIQILFRKENSKILNQLVSITQILISPLTIFLFIPIAEIFFSPLNCFSSNSPNECWTKIQILLAVLGALSCLIFISYLIFLNFLYFYPFPIKNCNIKLNSSIDILLLLIKLLFVLRSLLIKNEYTSVVVLLLPYLFLSVQQIRNPIYSDRKIEVLLHIRNNVAIWTYFMLLVCILCNESKINGLFYLLIIGYPIIIFCSIISFKKLDMEFSYQNSSFHNISLCISKTRFLINLVNIFIDSNKNNLKFNENGNQKNDILLKGIIKIHTETCLKENCPLTKFMKNDGNYNIQKQCLLNYMTIFFNNAMKRFPYSKLLK